MSRVVVCRECGNSRPSPDGFCTACGALLEWSGDVVGGTGTRGYNNPLPHVPPPHAPPGGGGVWQPPGAAPAYQPAPYPPAPPQAPPYYPPAPSPAPSPLRPQDEAQRHAPVAYHAQQNYDGPICTTCGAGNFRDRTYCRQCGSLLTTGPVFAQSSTYSNRLPWWRRIFRRERVAQVYPTPTGPSGHGNPGAYRARPGVSMGGRRFPWSRIAPILIVLGFMGIGLGPGRLWLTQQFGKAKTSLTVDYVAVTTPVTVTASSATPQRPAALMMDGNATTFWQAANGPAGQTLTFTFKGAVNVDRVEFEIGGEPFTALPRPRLLEYDGRGGKVAVNLDDFPGTQKKDIQVHNVTTLVFRVADSYPGAGGVAIREVRFLARK